MDKDRRISLFGDFLVIGMNVFPVDSFDCLIGGYVFDAKLFRDFIARMSVQMQFTHLFNNIFRKDGPWSGVAFCIASLCVSISSIISPGSKKQMRGIYAWPHITQVKNTFVFWYFSIMQFIRKTMCGSGLGFRSSNFKSSIAGRMQTSHPQPTTISFFYIFPKSFDRICPSFVIADLAESTTLRGEYFLAFRAFFFHWVVILKYFLEVFQWRYSMA